MFTTMYRQSPIIFRRAMLATIAMTLWTHCFADEWPQFRGAKFDGVAQSEFPVSWSETENIRWKIPIAGEGWSCPVVWGDSLFLTAAVPSGDKTATAEPYLEGQRQRADLTKLNYRWEVMCLDAKSGETRWRKTAREGNPPLERHRDNSYATETPVTDGKRVYAYFGMTGVYCYDMAGELQWKKDLGNFEMRAGWGTSSSPVLFAGKLFLQVDNEEQSFIVALDSESGDEVWRVDRDEPSQYSSPIIWTNSKRNELIAGGQVCRSYDPATGKVLWRLDMEKGRSSATPFAVGDRLFVGTELRNRGGSDDGGGFLFAVKAGATGNITLAENEKRNEYVLWKTAKAGIQMASPVLCSGHLYLFERRSSTLNCVNAETGKIAYRKRVPGARAFWASPWVSGDKVFCLDDNGTTHILAGGPEFRVLGRNVIEERAWSTPAIASSSLFLRTASHLYRVAE